MLKYFPELALKRVNPPSRLSGKKKRREWRENGNFSGRPNANSQPLEGIWVLTVSPRQLEEPQKEPEQVPLVDAGTGCFQRSRCIFRHLNPSKSLTLSV